MTTKQPRRPRTATAHRPASTGPTPAGPAASDMAFGAGLGADGPVVGPEPGFGEAGFGEPAASGLELAVIAILDAAAPPMDPRPDDVAQQLVRTLSDWPDLAERAAAWHDLGFWTGPRWNRAGVDGLAHAGVSPPQGSRYAGTGRPDSPSMPCSTGSRYA